jgi:SAM-dependent methyltransferase
VIGQAVVQGTAASFPDRTEAAPCPSCGHDGLRLFYEVRGIPVHSCLLVPTRDEALGYPTGDLRLGHCPACGFIANAAFDPADNRYSTQYEETQGFSPTFNAFARDLARDLAERHDLAGRTVLEIGCGKGEFLALLCELADCRGVGVDPGCRPERLPPEALERIDIVQDLYDERYAHLPADLVVCRHTLEHIAPVGRFLRDLRRTIGDRPEVIVFFELPDVRRVLDEGAFWDLYYEHCSYFTAGSLARLFRAAGFDVEALELVFGGQYIVITAVPAPEPTAAGNGLEDDLARLDGAVTGFADRCAEVMRRWRRHVEQRASAGGGVVLWGSGSKGVSFLTTLRLGDAVDAVVDINPHRQGHYMPGSGHEIVAPAALTALRPSSVIVMNPLYVPEIRQSLAGLGLDPEVVAL